MRDERRPNNFSPQPSALGPILLRPIVEAALREDIRSGDVTTTALVPADAMARARVALREAGVVCGLAAARECFLALDPSIRLEELAADGDQLAAGAVALRVEGNARAVLSAERVALNFLQRLSGIATLTRAYVDAVAGTRARIIDTRKTTPGLRVLEKHAVRCGGGSNHRFGLDDLILIKDNHIALCGGVAPAVGRARRHAGHAVRVEVECDTLEQVHEALAAGADIIMLDNMPPQTMRAAVDAAGGRALLEASGGVNLQTVRAIADTGVDLISVGALTHSPRALDIGLDLVELG